MRPERQIVAQRERLTSMSGGKQIPICATMMVLALFALRLDWP